MIIVAYDFTSNKVRARFSKYLQKYGRKIQYSIYEIRNSKRVLQNILREIELVYKKHFTGADSIIIFQMGEWEKNNVIRYGYSANDEKEVVYFG
jgi:CRISPR-associated protein Cas2